MKADPAFSDLVGRVYDCALDKSRWPSVLAEISGIVKGYLASIAVYDPTAGTVRFAAHHGYTDDLLALVHSIMHLNPLTPIGLVHPLLEPTCMSREQYAKVETIRASLYWRRGFAGRDHGDHVEVPLTRTVTEFGSWGVSRTETQGTFSDNDIAFTRLISPHIRRSVLISGVLGHQHVEVGTLRSALDALSAAALILAPDGQIVFRNAQAQAELDQRSMLREKHGRLRGVTIEAARLVAGLAAHDGSRGRDTRLEDASGRVLYASWIALEKVSDELGEPLLLILREPDKDLVTPLSAAATLFRLTPGELQVLAQLLNGRSLSEISDILGVARSTVKTHLDALFRKTDTRRQPDLIRVILGLASPLQR